MTRFVLTALPGAVLLAWTGYLWWHFGQSPLSEERSPSGLYGWPFAACWDTLSGSFASHDSAGVAYPLLSAATIVGVGAVAFVSSFRCAIAACLLPYLLLTASLGPIVWSSPEGYMKATGSVLVMALFLLQPGRGLVLSFVLAANLVVGLHWNVVKNVTAAPWYSPNLSLASPGSGPVSEGTNEPLTQFSAPVEWVNPTDELAPDYQGIWRFAHREAVPVRVRVTNTGATSWNADPAGGPNSIQVGYVLFRDDGSVADGHRLTITQDWPVGEAREFTLWVRLGKPGRYSLQISMYQEGQGRFFQRDETNGGRYPVRVR